MTKNEYFCKKQEIDKRYRKESSELRKEFALSNNSYSVGDIIEDYSKIIRIEEIIVSNIFSELPSCLYKGSMLTKKLLPYKSNKKGTIYQCNIKRKHNDSQTD